MMIEEYCDTKIAEYKRQKNKDADCAIACEIPECGGHYIGLYWTPYEYDENIEHLVMQCYKCRDQIEI